MSANHASHAEQWPADAEPLETGVPSLDQILGGGILRRSLTMILGAPGAGKTMLAQQIAFHTASRGANVTFLTGYSETHDKLLANGRGLRFFDEAAVGRSIQFFNLVDLLREGAEATEAAIVGAVRTHGAQLLIIDGFRSIRRFFANDQDVAHFLYSLGAKLALLGATTLLCLEGEPLAPSHEPELTVCDVILSLRREIHGTRERRHLEVVKARGAAPLPGLHPFTIGADGITVYPRWESTVIPREVPWSNERYSLGIPGIDALLGGGLTAQSTTLIVGTPGVGKTLLGLQFLSAAEDLGQPALYLGFTENRAQLLERSRAFGLHLAEAETAGRLRLVLLPGYDLDADQIAAVLAREVESRGVRRVMIDSLTEVERATGNSERKAEFLSALVTYLRNQNATTCITLDIASVVSPTLDFADTPLSELAENLVLLRYAEYRSRLHRLLAVLKMRFSDYDATLYEYTITGGRGIELLGPAPTAIGLLTGVARPDVAAAHLPVGELQG